MICYGDDIVKLECNYMEFFRIENILDGGLF